MSIYTITMSFNQQQTIGKFQSTMAQSLEDIGYKYALSILKEKLNTDSDFNKLFNKLIKDAVNSDTFAHKIGINALKESITNSAYSLEIINESQLSKYPIQEYKDVVASYYLYKNRLRYLNLISARAAVDGGGAVDDVRQVLGDTVYGYIVNIANYYVEDHGRHLQLSSVDKF